MEQEKSEITLNIEGRSLKPYMFVLITIISLLMQVLSSTGNDTSKVIVTLYFSIVIITFAVYKLRFYGVVAALLSALFFSLTIGQSWANTAINSGANFLQALLILLAFRYTSFSHNPQDEYLSRLKISAFAIGVLYVLLSLIWEAYYITFSSIIFVLLVIMYATDFVKSRNKDTLKYLLFVVLLPNITGALLGSLKITNGRLVMDEYCENLLIWFFSNAILMLGFGYTIFGFLKKQCFGNRETGKRFTNVKLSSIMFFTSTLLWNIIIYMLYYLGWLNKNIDSYFFPWAVGNLFFIANLYYSVYPETDDKGDDGFRWFENRSVVAENNTQMLVAIISFLLPICAQLLGTITYSISILFIFNITSAIISIGLIWIPKGQVRHMSAIKHIKTVFHLFTLSLLLLNIVLIINESVSL